MLPLPLSFLSWLRASLSLPKFILFLRRHPPLLQSSPAMAPPQPIVVLDPLSWPRSSVMPFALNELVNGGLLAPNVEGVPLAWIVPPASDREPNPPYGYVVSFVRLHERGFNAPASRFMWGMCYHYGVGAPQLRPLRDFARGHLRWHLRGVPGDPSELGSLGAPIPCGAAHSLHGRDTGASGGAYWRLDDRAAGLTQRVVPTVHDDIQQRGVGEGVVLPPQ
jgi:hypothetical protein